MRTFRRILGALLLVLMVGKGTITDLAGWEQTEDQQTTLFSDDGVATIRSVLPDRSIIDITVKAADISEDNYPYYTTYPHTKWTGWGASGQFPSKVISSVDIKLNGNPIWIKMSAYSDIADPRILSFESAANRFKVTIRGGDAGIAYTAEWFFDSKNVVRRNVWLGEFPEEIREETEYIFIEIPE